eukprot:scaffold44237_cov191-Amphora_coffeaeformis.AAC.1
MLDWMVMCPDCERRSEDTNKEQGKILFEWAILVVRVGDPIVIVSRAAGVDTTRPGFGIGELVLSNNAIAESCSYGTAVIDDPSTPFALPTTKCNLNVPNTSNQGSIMSL